MSATPDQPNPLVYFDIMVQDFDSGLVSYLGRVVMELRKDLLPKTCESFRALCTGECGVGVNGKPLHFKGSIFHRIVRDFCVQGGDITKFDGTGGENIYEQETGNRFMADEGFPLKHSKYCLSSANSGKNTNTSQFFFFMGPKPDYLDKKHVVFGKVVYGFDIIDTLNTYGTMDGAPTQHVIISNCGQFKKAATKSFYDLQSQKEINHLVEIADEL